MNFTREDWKLFLKKDTLAQKAGAEQRDIIPLVVKELTDNALDTVEEARGDVRSVSLGLIPGGFHVSDKGPGFGREELTRAFSVNRPLVSSKLLRLPSRGALGNGLRVVAGAVAAFDASLIVHTGGRRYDLDVRREDGYTTIGSESASEYPGTRVEILFGENAVDEYALRWGRAARLLSVGGRYAGLTSPYWYSAADLLELLHAADGTVRDVASLFEGNAGAKAGRVAAPWERTRAKELELSDAERLLFAMRENAKPFNHDRLGKIGEIDGLQSSYVHATGEYPTDTGLFIPFAVDVWAEGADDPALSFALNRTPTPGRCYTSHHKNEQTFYLPGAYGREIKTGRTPLSVTVNITTPYVAFTSDGKAPDLSPLLKTGLVDEAIRRAAARAKSVSRRERPREEAVSKKRAILDAIPDAVLAAGGNGQYEFSQRQLFYVVRPSVIEAAGSEPDYGYFCEVLTEYESENEDIKGLYRDNRGVLYIPHAGEEIPVGTRTVSRFKRPEWTFHKIVYCEKEGFFPILRSAKWPERWDCALLTSKGYASRAVKDLLDLLGDDGEPIEVFCIHDADLDGTRIYQTLKEETKSRGKRRVEIHNLGLEPGEGVEMGLPVEKVDRKTEKEPADYVPHEWRGWLKKNRIELNAMSTPQFIRWLDAKMERYAPPKLLPPEEVVRRKYKTSLLHNLNDTVKKSILREAGYHARTRSLFRNALEGAEEIDWTMCIASALNEDRSKEWRDPVATLAEKMARRIDS